ncbi:MAG: peptide chain release factor 3, partial [Psittacicella sp.]
QLSEEGAVQIFRPLINNDLIVGAIGILQLDVVIYRLKHEYSVEADYESISISTIRWVKGSEKDLKELEAKYASNLALDSSDELSYIASSNANLRFVEDKYPNIEFLKTREH